MSKKNEMQEVLDEIKAYYMQWLSASEMTEEEFLSNRNCRKFQIRIEEMEANGSPGLAAIITKEEGMPIGLPFFVGYNNTKDEKEQYFENTPLLLIFMAGQLDKANQESPLNGSPVGSYFRDRTINFVRKLIKRKEDVLASS